MQFALLKKRMLFKAHFLYFFKLTIPDRLTVYCELLLCSVKVITVQLYTF